MNAKAKLFVALTGAVAWIVVDQLTKALFKQVLTPGDVKSFFFGTLLLVPIYNHGAFLSLGAGMSDAIRSVVFTYGVAIIMVVLFVWLIRSTTARSREAIAVACILGGGLGNLLDRCIYNGRVFDFLNLGIGSLRTGIFNVADMAIMLGMALLVLRRVKPAVNSPR
jgi:signal peptidase II